MDQILVSLINLIRASIPGISLIDEDTGQLDELANDSQDGYPVTFPCVLLGNTTIDWKDVSPTGSVQIGEGVLIIRLAIDCYDDTHAGSGTTDKIAERGEFARNIYKAVQGWRASITEMGPLKRVRSRDYTLPGNIKVYEQMYRIVLNDSSAAE